MEKEKKKIKIERDYIEPDVSPHVVDLRRHRVSAQPIKTEAASQSAKGKHMVIDLQKLIDFLQKLIKTIESALRSFLAVFHLPAREAPGFHQLVKEPWGQRVKFRFKEKFFKYRQGIFDLPARVKKLPQLLTIATHRLKNFFVFRPLPGWLKPLLTFALICFLLILPLRILVIINHLKEKQNKVLGATTEAFASLQAGTLAFADFNLGAAKVSFDTAADAFTSAQKELATLNNLLVNLAELTTAKGHLLTAGKHLIQAGRYLSQAGAQMSVGLEAGLGGANLSTSDQSNQVSSDQVNFLTLVKSFEQNLEQSLPNIKRAQEEILQVKAASLPGDQALVLQQVQDKLPLLEAASQRLLLLSKTLRIFLGDEQPRRYLVIFQNNNELRPTGGFMGGLAIVDFYQGRIEKFEVPKGGPYDLSGWLPVKVAAPLPLRLVNPVWSIQDANWFADFPTSAEKIIWFYSKAWGGSSVDGVITLTPDMITELLGLTGPIEMPEYQKVITQDNFIIETQKAVELEYDPELNQPKQFIADLTPKLLDRVLSLPPENYSRLIQIIASGFAQKQILIYLENENLQRIISDFGWTGELKSAPGDYLLLVDTNIGGGKTNGVIDQLVDYQVIADNNGQLTAKVEITRIHRGIEGDLFTGIKNISYLRVYVPKGSQLIEADGFEPWYENMLLAVPPDYEEDQQLVQLEQNSIRDERTETRIYEENDKTVFANWIGVEPGKSATVSLVYRLPFKLETGGVLNATDSYSLLLQKQPGSRPESINCTLLLPSDWQVNWLYPKDENLVAAKNNQINYQTVLNADNYWAAVVTKKN